MPSVALSMVKNAACKTKYSSCKCLKASKQKSCMVGGGATKDMLILWVLRISISSYTVVMLWLSPFSRMLSERFYRRAGTGMERTGTGKATVAAA